MHTSQVHKSGLGNTMRLRLITSPLISSLRSSIVTKYGFPITYRVYVRVGKTLDGVSLTEITLTSTLRYLPEAPLGHLTLKANCFAIRPFYPKSELLRNSPLLGLSHKTLKANCFAIRPSYPKSELLRNSPFSELLRNSPSLQPNYPPNPIRV